MEKGQVFGQSCTGLLAKYDQNTHSLKTFQLSLLEEEPESLEILPKSGMTVNGKLWEQTMWAHPTGGNESGLWPTPSAQQAGEGEFFGKLKTKDGIPPEPNRRAYNPETGQHVQITLNRAVKMWPTPSATPRGAHTGAISGSVAEDGMSRVSENGTKWGATLETAVKMNSGKGSLNPDWTEHYLMGYPYGWTNLTYQELE